MELSEVLVMLSDISKKNPSKTYLSRNNIPVTLEYLQASLFSKTLKVSEKMSFCNLSEQTQAV